MKILIVTILISLYGFTFNQTKTPADYTQKLATFLAGWDSATYYEPVLAKLIKIDADTFFGVNYCANSCFCNLKTILGYRKNGNLELLELELISSRNKIKWHRIKSQDIHLKLRTLIYSEYSACPILDDCQPDYFWVNGGPSLIIVSQTKEGINYTYTSKYYLCKDSCHAYSRKQATELMRVLNTELTTEKE